MEKSSLETMRIEEDQPILNFGKDFYRKGEASSVINFLIVIFVRVVRILCDSG